MRDLCKASPHALFSASFPAAGLRTLLGMLAPSTGPLPFEELEISDFWNKEVSSGGVVREWQSIQVLGAEVAHKFFFSIVAGAPSKSKRARRGDLLAGDLGISLHQVVRCNFEDRSLEVASTPLAVQAAHVDDVQVASFALVLPVACLSLHALEETMVWSTGTQLSYFLRGSPSTRDSSESVVTNALLERLMSSDGHVEMRMLAQHDREQAEPCWILGSSTALSS